MSFNGREVFTVLEFGDSKICALHGGRDKGGNPEIFGFGCRESKGAVVKGDISDFARTVEILSGALDDADKSAGEVFSREKVYYLISGRGISSRCGEGNVMIYGDPRIGDPQIQEAVEKAQNLPIPQELVQLDSFSSYFMIDGTTRVKNPCGHSASRLDAFIHMILAERNRVDTMRSAIRDLGFEREIIPVFSGIASAYGCLTLDEKEDGVLLVDIGAGVTEYVIVCNDGVLSSGVVPIGTDNVANDLAVGLDFSIELARRIVLEGRIEKLKRSGAAYFETECGASPAPKRRIPVGSFEKIIEERMLELFGFLRKTMEKQAVPLHTFTGVVLTGGGAMIPAFAESARSSLGIHVRTGDPLAFAGAMTGLDNPRFGALLGGLRFALEVNSVNSSQISILKVADALEDFTGELMRKMKNVTKVFGK